MKKTIKIYYPNGTAPVIELGDNVTEIYYDVHHKYVEVNYGPNKKTIYSGMPFIVDVDCNEEKLEL